MIYKNKIKSIQYTIFDRIYDYTIGESWGAGICKEINFRETADGTPYINIITDIDNFSIMYVPFEVRYYDNSTDS